MSQFFDLFHFLRPLWLIAVPVVLILWWMVRPHKTAGQSNESGIAPHLAAALRVGKVDERRILPIDGVALTAVLIAIAVAGPAWTRVPNPLIADTAPLVVALKVTPSMQGTDLAPSRADRARFKILDLIAERAGARTALVAYAGTAHRVAPLTEDPNILRPLLESLTPDAMPVDGENAPAALDIAASILSDADTPGAILFVLDDLGPTAVEAFNAPDLPPVLFLIAAPDSVTLPQLDRIDGATIVRISPDDHDIHQIERRVRAAYAAALAGDERLRWEDRGWWLAWPAALLILLWFRRGWTMRWVWIIVLASAFAPSGARADGWVDWFFTPDQQGQIALNRKEYARAGEVFADPYLNGYAKYKAGQYEEAATVFAGIATAEAAFGEGMAHMKSRGYRPAIAAFEKALERQPDFPEAQHNLEVARYTLDYIEDAREQSDTGEDSGIGADDVVFDNDEARGATTQVEAPSEDAAPLTADQWISSIDTNMTQFLRSRFLMDNAGDNQ
ncbi:VWA domain-containing protein [Phaeobacter marinintestinus]|uniref:VWA domain-containing protein n=1 Tax=Falsiphaeobacter marinintestinus TaxID=1492905 RepID=UPI0011B58EBB|nr:VWA domain-containing protein [Phaeobacter marinintestinus]